MRRLYLLVVGIALAGCPKDDSATPMPDAGSSLPDAGSSGDPLAVDFAALPATIQAPASSHVLGPDGNIYALDASHLLVSADGGATFTIKTPFVASELVATATGMFVHRSGQAADFMRSTDGASWLPVTVPDGTLSPGVQIAATANALWVERSNGSGMIEMWRSADDGANWSQITLPTTTAASWFLVSGRGNYLVIWAVNHLYRSADGAVWEDLGTLPMLQFQSIAVTQTGTVLAYATNGMYILNRRTVGAAMWTTDAGTNKVMRIAQRPNGEVVRVDTYGGGIDVSSTDGASWTAGQTATLSSCQVLSLAAFDQNLLGSCYDGTNNRGIRLATTGTWIVEDAAGLPYGSVARFADVAFTPSGRIVLAGRNRLYITDDGGASWHHSAVTFDDTNPITAVAARDDNNRVFVGSTIGRYAFLDGTGDHAIVQASFAAAQENVMQANWAPGTLLFVTTAKPDSSAGSVFEGDIDRVGVWHDVNPFRLESDPTFDPPAGFYGIEACAFSGTFDLIVGARQFVTTNGYTDFIKTQYRYNQDGWSDIAPPVFYGVVMALSCAPNGTQSVLVDNDRLYVGSFLGPKYRPITPNGLDGHYKSAKFAPDNHLWVITDSGVFRSVLAIDEH